jgi:hypothetical protein
MIPSAVIRGTYNTWEDMRLKDLNKNLGNVVGLNLENLIKIEIKCCGIKSGESD